MTQGAPPIRHVLAVVDPHQPVALASAASLAARHGAKLSILTCIEAPRDVAALAKASGQSCQAILDRMREDHLAQVAGIVARTLPDNSADLHLTDGKPFVEIIRHVLANGIDFVVKAAAPPTGARRFLFASADQHLVRKCPCPVWLQMPQSRHAPRRILAAVDVDDWDASEPGTLADLNRRVLQAAMRVADGPEAIIYVLHAWETVGEGMMWAFSSNNDPRLRAQAYVNEVLDIRTRALAELVRSVQHQSAEGTRPQMVPRLIRGPAEITIPSQANDLRADAIVMGTVARTGLGGFIIGNTAEDILNNVDRAIVAVKPGTFVSPLGA